jgi:hypothetical protein
MLSLTPPRHTSTLPIRDIASTSRMRKERTVPDGLANGLRLEGGARKERTFLDDASQDRPQCQYQCQTRAAGQFPVTE